MNNAQDFGEVVEVYTPRSVLQVQRMTKQQKAKNLVTIKVTVAPVLEGMPSFSEKHEMLLQEHQLAQFCIAMMGLKLNTEIKGVSKENLSKSLYVNINQDNTVNIISTHKINGAIQKHSITFKPEYRYQLLRLAVSQLTLNSSGYEQSVGDTLNILKASTMSTARSNGNAHHTEHIRSHI